MAKKVKRRLDRDRIDLDLEQLVSRLEVLVEVVIRLLHRPDARDLGEFDDRLRLDVDHDAARNVVDDDRLVADVGDGAEVLDDASGGGLVVVRRDDEEPVYTELVRFTREVDGVGGGIGTGAGDDGRPPVEGVNGDPEQLEPFVVRESWALTRRPRDDDPV